VRLDAAQSVPVGPGDYLIVSVTDTGVGMPPEIKARFVTPLFTARGPGQGIGPGLPAVNDEIRQPGGVLVMTSRLGEGTKTALARFVKTAFGREPPGNER
jgi:C4-dicarboxylate-specific signal transduction histidine kinase